MSEISAEFAFFMGLTSIISPLALPFLGIVTVLTIVAVKTKKRIFSIVSIVIVATVLVGSHFTMLAFPVGPVLGSLITKNDHVLMSIFFLGGVSIPSVITAFGFIKAKKDMNHLVKRERK